MSDQALAALRESVEALEEIQDRLLRPRYASWKMIETIADRASKAARSGRSYLNSTGIVEREAEYVDIARARIEWWSQHQGREADEVLAISRRSEAEREQMEDMGQMELL